MAYTYKPRSYKESLKIEQERLGDQEDASVSSSFSLTSNYAKDDTVTCKRQTESGDVKNQIKIIQTHGKEGKCTTTTVFDTDKLVHQGVGELYSKNGQFFSIGGKFKWTPADRSSLYRMTSEYRGAYLEDKIKINLQNEMDIVGSGKPFEFNSISYSYYFRNFVTRLMFSGKKNLWQAGFFHQMHVTEKEPSTLGFKAVFQPCGHFNAYVHACSKQATIGTTIHLDDNLLTTTEIQRPWGGSTLLRSGCTAIVNDKCQINLNGSCGNGKWINGMNCSISATLDKNWSVRAHQHFAPGDNAGSDKMDYGFEVNYDL